MYLGCNIIKGQIRRQRDGAMLNSSTYDMESFLEQCVARYLAVAGPDVKLREARTPFLAATAVRGPYRDPASGDNGCSWCGFVPADHVGEEGKKADGSGGPRLPDQVSSAVELPRGQLAAVAASVLMKCMYAARMARFDLLRAVQGLARYLTKWTTRQDAELFRLMCYIHTTKAHKMTGWVNDPFHELQGRIHSDSDFDGCEQTSRSTSGIHTLPVGQEHVLSIVWP